MTPNEAIPNLLPVEPLPIPAGFEGLRLGVFKETPLVDCRVISEDNYQLLGDTISELKAQRDELLEALKAAHEETKFLVSLNNASNFDSVMYVFKKRLELIEAIENCK